MGFEVTEESAVSTAVAVEAVLPLLRKHFKMEPDANHILEKMYIRTFRDGGAFVQIGLSVELTPEQMVELREAMNQKPVDIDLFPGRIGQGWTEDPPTTVSTVGA